jgi:hypothetical protein
MNKLINAVAKSWSSAGRRLVVRRKSRVGINACCSGYIRSNTSGSRPLKERGLCVYSETIIGIMVIAHWGRLKAWKDL